MRISTNPALQQALDLGQVVQQNLAKAGEVKADQSSGSLSGAIGPAGRLSGGEEFGRMLMDVLNEVNNSQSKSRELQTDLMTGRRPVELHDVMIAMEQASTSMQLTMAVRNKVLEAYQEISRMQV